eukprot:3679650-Pyramimonas_sp.AAC.1
MALRGLGEHGIKGDHLGRQQASVKILPSVILPLTKPCLPTLSETRDPSLALASHMVTET